MFSVGAGGPKWPRSGPSFVGMFMWMANEAAEFRLTQQEFLENFVGNPRNAKVHSLIEIRYEYISVIVELWS